MEALHITISIKYLLSLACSLIVLQRVKPNYSCPTLVIWLSLFHGPEQTGTPHNFTEQNGME